MSRKPPINSGPLFITGFFPAVTSCLKAGLTTVAMPDGAAVPMVGFGLSNEPVSVPGPVLEANAGDTLTINLNNPLPVPITIVIHGQKIAVPAPVMLGGRVLSFTPHSGTFSFPDLREGTYLYESGTYTAAEVPIGLYGALIVRSATPGQAYDDPVSAYDREQVVVFSDVDPTLNQAIVQRQYGTQSYPSTVDYAARYFLINGKAYPNTAPILADNADRVLLRLVNAGSKNYNPTLNGPYMKLIAEDGNLLPYSQDRISVLLSAGKTKNVIVTSAPDKRYALYDRQLNLSNAGSPGVGGLLTFLQFGNP